MKKTKRTLLLAAAIACFAFTVAGGCAQKGPNSSQSSSFDDRWTVIEGYDVAESITVDEKEIVSVPLPIVTDGAGNVLDVYYEVMTMDGGYVGTSADKFFASNVQGYKIRYVVVGKDGATYEKITEIIVNSASALDLSATYDVFVERGVEANIVPVCNMETPTFTYSVVNKDTQTALDVSEDGAYVCEALGWHTVTLEATSEGETALYSYDVYCREPMQEGEVEVFDADWEIIRLLQNYGTYDAKYTNTAESGVKDRFGLDSDFLMLKTSNFVEYANLYINPRGTEEYYRQLAAEGYTHVSFWIYSESTIPHDAMLQLFPSKGLYTFDIGAVMPNKWVEMKVNLVEDKAYYESCFSAAVDYFKKQETPVLQFDNTNGWNGPNGSYGYESDMIFYISDVYAVKPSGIERNSDAATQYGTGETLSLSTLFTIPDGVEVQYAVSYKGKTVPVEEKYTFLANGTYEISVITPSNLSCDQTVALKVVDGVTASITSIVKERGGEEVIIDLSQLGVEFTLENQTLEAMGYTVSLDGEDVSVENNQFTAKKDGGYIVEYEIPYTVGEMEYLSYVEVKIDVWSQNSKYLISDAAHMFASSEYCGASNWDKQPTYEVGEYTVGEKTGTMLKISEMGEALLVPFKPVYTKTYYEALFSEMPEAKVVVSYYVTPQESGISVRCYADGYSGGSPIYNKWNTTVISLADFIEDYDTLNEGYNEIKYLKDNDIVQTHNRNENDYLLWMTGAGHLNKVTVYVTEVYITDKVEVENDGVWNDLVNADAVSTTINPWTSAQATRNGLVNADEIVSIGGEGQAAYTKVTVGEGFFCYGGYQIKPSVTIKDAWESYADKDIVFDWYYDITGDTENQYNYNVSVYGKAEVAYTQDTWHTSRISMADLLADWDDVIAGSNNGGDGSPWTPWIKFKYTTAQHAEQAGVVYLGNIRFEEHIDDETGDEGGDEDETPKFWNDLSSTDAIKTTANRWSQTIPAIPSTSEISSIGGVDGVSYIRIDGGAGFFMYAGYKILPMGTKADYEQYAGLTLVFDWYYSIPTADTNYAVSVYGAADERYAEGTWNTVTIAIDDLLAEWEDLIDDSNPMSKGTAWLDFNWVDGEADAAGVLYIGNIRLGAEAPENPELPGDSSPETPDDPEQSDEGLYIWNDLTSEESLRTNNNRYSHSVPTTALVNELTAINAAKTSGYVKIVALADQFDYAGYLVIPSGEKTAYEAFATYNLVFDWYFDLTDDAVGLATKVSVYGGSVKEYAQDTWHTESISMAALLAEWEALNTYAWNSMGGTPWLQFKHSNIKAGTVYIGNIRLAKVETEQPELPDETLPVWNDMSQASAVTTTVNPWTASQATRNGLVSESTVAAIGGVSGAAYTSISLGTGFLCYGGYQIVPTNTDKTAWEAYSGYNIVFDWYYDVTGDTENQYNYNVSVYGGANTEFAQDTWHTSSVAMADILADWADVIAGSNNGGDNSPWTPWIKFKQTSAAHEAQSGIVYIGNIRLEKAAN